MPDAVSNLERLLAEVRPGRWKQDKSHPSVIVLSEDDPKVWDVLGEMRDVDDARLVAASPVLLTNCLALAKALRKDSVRFYPADCTGDCDYAPCNCSGEYRYAEATQDALAAFERDFGDDNTRESK